MPWTLPLSVLRRRVQIAVRIEPKQSKAAPLLGERGRHAGDRARTQRMIAAEDERSMALAHRLRARVRQVAANVGDGREKIERARHGGKRRAIGHAKIADVLDVMPQLAKAIGQMRDAQR